MIEHSSLPRLSIASLGGTVSMQAGAAGCGVAPALDCEQQLLQVPQLREMAQLNVASLSLLPSASRWSSWRCWICWSGPAAR